MKIIIFFLGCAFSSTAVVLLSYIGVFDIFDSVAGVEKEPAYTLPTYLSFISVMMTSVTVVLAVFAITIGVISFYTIKEIRETAIDKAIQAATKQAKKSLHPDNIEKIILEAMFEPEPNEPTDDTSDNNTQK